MQTELLTLSNYFRYILEEITNQRDENTSSFVQLDISLNPNSFSVRVSRALTTNAGRSFFHETAQFSSHITYICNHQASQSGSQSLSKIVFNSFYLNEYALYARLITYFGNFVFVFFCHFSCEIFFTLNFQLARLALQNVKKD